MWLINASDGYKYSLCGMKIIVSFVIVHDAILAGRMWYYFINYKYSITVLIFFAVTHVVCCIVN